MAPLTTFHPFPRLPWELRNEIWKQSIRPLDRPGAHIFCLDLREPEDVTAKECDVQCPPILSVPLRHECPRPPLGIVEKSVHITVPAKTLSSGRAGNPSAYMIDGGLWTACKESREVMERAFNHQKWDPIRKAYPAYRKLWKATIHDRMHIRRTPPPPDSDDSSPPPPRPRRSPRERPPTPVNPYDAERGYFSIPATAFFWSSPSMPHLSSSNELSKADHSKGQAAASPHYFTVLPMQDLIIIRPSIWTPHMHEGYWRAFEHGFPFGAENHGFPGFCGWKGFAIEYDPSWGQKPEFGAFGHNRATWWDNGSLKWPDGTVGIFDIIYDAISNFSDYEQIQTIWLIDYRLKPKHHTPTAIGRPDNTKRVFHGGDGCQFVEIYSEFVESGGDYLNGYYTEGIDRENSAMGEGSCHWFIEEFEACMFGDLYDSDESVDSNYSRYPPHIGLLACLP